MIAEVEVLANTFHGILYTTGSSLQLHRLKNIPRLYQPIYASFLLAKFLSIQLVPVREAQFFPLFLRKQRHFFVNFARRKRGSSLVATRLKLLGVAFLLRDLVKLTHKVGHQNEPLGSMFNMYIVHTHTWSLKDARKNQYNCAVKAGRKTGSICM